MTISSQRNLVWEIICLKFAIEMNVLINSIIYQNKMLSVCICAKIQFCALESSVVYCLSPFSRASSMGSFGYLWFNGGGKEIDAKKSVDSYIFFYEFLISIELHNMERCNIEGHRIFYMKIKNVVA